MRFCFVLRKTRIYREQKYGIFRIMQNMREFVCRIGKIRLYLAYIIQGRLV